MYKTKILCTLYCKLTQFWGHHVKLFGESKMLTCLKKQQNLVARKKDSLTISDLGSVLMVFHLRTFSLYGNAKPAEAAQMLQ